LAEGRRGHRLGDFLGNLAFALGLARGDIEVQLPEIRIAFVKVTDIIALMERFMCLESMVIAVVGDLYQVLAEWIFLMHHAGVKKVQILNGEETILRSEIDKFNARRAAVG
jgi:hypothetical protein